MSNKVDTLFTNSATGKYVRDEMEKDDGLTKPPNDDTAFHDTVKEFTEDVDILGLKFLCRENTHLFRKLLYLVFVLFGSGFAIYQIVDQACII